MKKFLLFLMTSTALMAAPKAVVFDFGGVMTGSPKREAVVDFLCESMQLSKTEFEQANLKKKQTGKPDAEFWMDFAKTRGLSLSKNWENEFKASMKDAIGATPEMYTLVEELKQEKVPVALLSNIDHRLSKIVREAGLYEPFSPCLLSCEIGLEKPDPNTYKILLETLNLQAHEVTFIDDKRENVESAQALGLDAILFESPKQIREALQKRDLLHQLNPSEKAFGEFLEDHKKAHPGKPLKERSIEELREGVKVFAQYAGEPANVSFVDQHILARDGFPIPIRIYNDQLPSEAPVLIFYPGCAFVFDLFEVNSAICSRIAQLADAKVILVQFRLAPENPMPTSLYDGYDAAAYIATHPQDFGIDPEKIVLGGWCSGAHSAAAISSLAREENRLRVAHQILLSGCYDLTESNHGFDSYEKEDKILNRTFTAHIATRYYGTQDFTNPLLSPYYETHFAGLPSTTLIFGEYDALRNDSESYYHKLESNGVPVEKIILKGQTHNSVAMRTVLTDSQDPAEIIAKVMKERQGSLR